MPWTKPTQVFLCSWLAPVCLCLSLSISICISVSQHESLVTGTRLEPYQGPTDPFLGCSPPPPQTHYSPSPPKPHRLLLSLSLCISERSRIEHNPRNQPDRVSESSIRSVGLSVGRRRQRQTGRHLGPSLRHRCSLPGTLFPTLFYFIYFICHFDCLIVWHNLILLLA